MSTDERGRGEPLPSVLAAFFLLGVQTTYTLVQQYNTGTQYAITDVLANLWAIGRSGHRAIYDWRFVIGDFRASIFDLRLSIFAASNLVHLLTPHCR